MDERLTLFYSELLAKCKSANCYEFEFYWESWGILWDPWFLEIDGKSQVFSMNDVSFNDLEKLINLDLIELIKKYRKAEMKDEFDRKRYRLKIKY